MKITEQQSGSESNEQETTPRGPADDRHQRQKLMAILEECGVSAAGFETLRKDAYEKMIAAESPENLEVVYEALLDPALGLAEVRAKCPVWPTGSNYAGKLPSLMTLRDIKERILLDWQVTERLKGGCFAKRLREEVPIDEVEFFETMAELLGTELITAKLDGVRISDNLRVFDRMLRASSFKLRLQTNRRMKEQTAWRQEEKIGKANDEIRNQATRESARPAIRKEMPKSNPQVPAEIQVPKAKVAPVQTKTGNGLLNLVPTLDLGLGGLPQLNGKGYDSTVRSMAEKILAVGGPS